MSGTLSGTLVVASVYFLSTGRIVGTLTHSGGASAASDIFGEIEGVHDGAAYWVNSSTGTPTLAARPAMGVSIDKTTLAADSTDTATFAAIPAGAVLTLDPGTETASEPMTISDGHLVFTCAVPGTYTLFLSAFPALDQSFIVVAT